MSTCPNCGHVFGRGDTPRSGDALRAVREAFRMRTKWTRAGLVEETGFTPKAVSNALGYLTRHGVISREAYGRYAAI